MRKKRTHAKFHIMFSMFTLHLPNRFVLLDVLIFIFLLKLLFWQIKTARIYSYNNWFILPISTGTVDLHKYNLLCAVGDDCALCSLLFFKTCVMQVKHSNWQLIISSRLLDDLVAISLNRVCTQKLKRSAIGIPEIKM